MSSTGSYKMLLSCLAAILTWAKCFLISIYVGFKLKSIPVAFPFYETRKNATDPRKTQLIFPRYEWDRESPKKYLSAEDKDHLIFHGSDPDTGDQLIVSFDRISPGLCQVWVVLRVDAKEYVYDNHLAIDNSDGIIYSGGGLRLECDAPMRRWRIAFNGCMKKADAPQEQVHVKFGVRFAAGSHPFEFPKNIPSCEVAKVFALQSHDTVMHSLDSFCKTLSGYDQSGALYCDITVDGARKTCPLFGGKVKNVSKPLLNDATHLYGYASNGMSFHLIQSPQHTFGNCFSPAHYIKPVRSVTIFPDNKGVSFNCAHVKYNISWTQRSELEAFVGGSSSNDEVSLFEGTVTLGEESFRVSGFKQASEVESSDIRIPQELLHHRVSLEDNDELVVSTAEDSCKREDLTGGKGSSLAVLTSVASQFKSFVVPKAVVLTVNAYEVFSRQEDTKLAIETILEKANQNKDLKEASKQCVNELEKSQLPVLIKKELSTKMVETFGMKCDDMKFAVRSSAVGEDSEDMSAAGQMTTFLGVVGQENICNAIVKCWASQFSFTAVNYKRQYGQPLNSRMAVVVQEMVDAESAGVMFTCDPVTGNPLFTAITANYGLGESVVSASADPDTFMINKKGSIFVVSEELVGKKSEMIEQSSSGGTITKQVSEENAKKTCISQEMAVTIAWIGNEVESCYGTCRDIEWAVRNGQVYLLQCRPVTSFYKESDYEISHDLDVALRTNRELLSRANIDEVMPGALSPISLAHFAFVFDGFVKYRFISMAPGVEYEQSPYCNLSSFSIGKKWYMNLSEASFGKGDEKRIKGFMMAMFGRDVSQDEAFLRSITHERPKKLYSGILGAITTIRNLFAAKPAYEGARDVQKNFTLQVNENMNSSQVLQVILRRMHQMKDGGVHLMNASFPSMIMNSMIMAVITKLQGEEDPSPETMALFSKLLKSDYDIESANIPASMTKLASAIRRSSKGTSFSDMDDKDAVEWLETSDEEAAQKYREFITRHGHRCYKEFDMYSNPWDIDPVKLVRTLKASVVGEERLLNEDEGISLDQLPNKPSFGQRMFLNFIIPRAKFAVFAREATKSNLVHTINTVRKAIRLLGKKMADEGRLPDAELVHFLTFDELHRLLNTSNPALVTRAIRRCRLHTKLDKEKFPVLQCGMPSPIVEEPFVVDPNCSQWVGTPVSEGEVKGPARVINDFESEAHLIQKGEILITNATDTGWTPYFPLLSGVVTEIGGLLSHGAVVAREYGLPAVVGVTGATQIFKNGDIVHINGGKGIISKLEATNSP